MSTDNEGLNPQRVDTIFIDCLFRDDEDKSRHIVAEGIVLTVGFHPGRIEAHRQEIHDMLAELPDEFKTSSGGGHSFLNACMDKHGNQWTDQQRTLERLVLLGIAIGEVVYCLPRNKWMIFSGGLPSFMVKQ